MSTFNIMIPSAEAVDDFCARAAAMPFDLNLGAGTRVVDAKSILGVLYLGVGKILRLTVPTDHASEVHRHLHEFLV